MAAATSGGMAWRLRVRAGSGCCLSPPVPPNSTSHQPALRRHPRPLGLPSPRPAAPLCAVRCSSMSPPTSTTPCRVCRQPCSAAGAPSRASARWGRAGAGKAVGDARACARGRGVVLHDDSNKACRWWLADHLGQDCCLSRRQDDLRATNDKLCCCRRCDTHSPHPTPNPTPHKHTTHPPPPTCASCCLQRLKGKHGRIRGNLMGKRVDFSARTVITGAA